MTTRVMTTPTIISINDVMAGAGSVREELFLSADSGRWQASLDSYHEVLALITSTKNRGSSSGSLALLDKWYQTELPANVASRSEPHLTHEELCQLMKWKLTRGKFRPRLMEMVKENSSEDVESVTAAAIAALPDLERAVSLASKLRAVGPATASAILCAGCRDVPFMADEAVVSVVPSLGKLTYTPKQYLQYASRLQEKARQLSTGDEGKVWTAHEVELALWAHHHSTRLSPSQTALLGKRKREGPVAEDSHTPSNKKKVKISDS